MFKVLFGCTGNRCRSPFAQAHFARLARKLPVEVLSAGTLDAPGQRVPQELVDIGLFSGLDLASHRSQTLAPDAFPDLDLFIGFERAHVASAVTEAGIPYDKAFTLPELVRLLGEIDPPKEDDPINYARAAVASAARKRREQPEFVPGEEVPDPFRRSAREYQRAADHIVELSKGLFFLLFGEQSSQVAS